jgi:DnaJ-class molecular chaperone
MSEIDRLLRLLQISVNADPRPFTVYRIQAQRFHPDNQETGDAKKFRAIVDAYAVPSDPRSGRKQVFHQQQRQDRWKLVEPGPRTRPTSTSSR